MVCLDTLLTMKPSFRRHPVAVLREICGLYQKEFADLIGCSRIYLQKIEQTPQHGGQQLSEKLAQRIFHETGVSLSWLLGGNPSAPPISGSGEPYTKEIFERNQANKSYYDRPHPVFRNIDAIGFCARLIAILESAAKREKYYMALYKTHAALTSLQAEFGMDENLYQFAGPHHVNNSMAIALLQRVLARDRELQDQIKKLRHPASKPESKRPSKKRRRR